MPRACVQGVYAQCMFGAKPPTAPKMPINIPFDTTYLTLLARSHSKLNATPGSALSLIPFNHTSLS